MTDPRPSAERRPERQAPPATGDRPYRKPELTRVELRPEEAVLGACKSDVVSCGAASTVGS